MKKLFLGLGLVSLALLSACGGKKNERTKIAQKTDDTDLTKYTLTTGEEIYSSVNRTRLFNYVKVNCLFYLNIDDQVTTNSGILAFGYNPNSTLWEIDASKSTTSFLNQEESVRSYTFDNFDGLYYSYYQLESVFEIEGYEIVNWYTKNTGGYRAVAIYNGDYDTLKTVFEWDFNGYIKSAHLESEIITEDNVESKLVNSLSYTFSTLE